MTPVRTAARGRPRLPEVNERAAEWLCAGIMMSWGVTLAVHGDTLSLPAFAAFHRFGATAAFWAWVFGGCGFARTAALYINGRWPKTPVIRMVCAGLGFVSWSQLSWLFFEGTYLASGIPTTGIGVYAVLALAELFSIYRAAHDARYHHA